MPVRQSTGGVSFSLKTSAAFRAANILNIDFGEVSAIASESPARFAEIGDCDQSLKSNPGDILEGRHRDLSRRLLCSETVPRANAGPFRILGGAHG
jgi:hypothetical protein